MGVDRIIPHSDGSGVIAAVGADVDPTRVGQKVWIWNGQWQRAFGTAAEAIVSRIGLEKVRHMEVKYLWAQEANKSGRFVVRKIDG